MPKIQPRKFWEAEIAAATLFPDLIGRSPLLQKLAERIRKIARKDWPVLIFGQSGSGKEAVARAIHSQSSRQDKPFVAVNCGGLSETLLESELFGHKKGAFTGADRNRVGYFETAAGGTLFLDEIGELSLAAQSCLLRTLETGRIVRLGDPNDRPVDIRLIAATHSNLPELVQAKTFRADLFFRLLVLRLAVPPLDERREDIPLLAWHFALQAARAIKQPLRDIEPGLLAKLQADDWPGNVRELKHHILAMLAECDDDVLSLAHEPPLIFGGRGFDLHPVTGEPIPDKDTSAPNLPAFTEKMHLDEMNRRYIAWMIAECNGNKAEAARQLAVPLSSLYDKMAKLGLR